MSKKTKIHLAFQIDENGDYVVSDNLSLMYGVGKSPLLALKDYSISLVEYVEIMDKQSASQKQTELASGNVGGESPRQPYRDRVKRKEEQEQIVDGAEGGYYRGEQYVIGGICAPTADLLRKNVERDRIIGYPQWIITTDGETYTYKATMLISRAK